MAFSSTAEEKLLLSQVAGGNEEAFRKLFDRFSGSVYNKSFLVLRNSMMAEDVIQEVFIKLWISREKIVEITDLQAYLNVLTRNHIFNLLRKQAHHERFIEELNYTQKTAAGTGSEPALTQELIDRIHRVISDLPPQQKRVYELSRAEGLKREEIARRLGISAETVKKHLSEAMKTLRSRLSDFKTFLFLFSISGSGKKN